MISHTLIFSTPKTLIPADCIKEFIHYLFDRNVLNIDYFGAEQDNQADYMDIAMQTKNDNSTIITFHFEDGEIDYEAISELETIKIAKALFVFHIKTNIILDDKDITIYFV